MVSYCSLDRSRLTYIGSASTSRSHKPCRQDSRDAQLSPSRKRTCALQLYSCVCCTCCITTWRDAVVGQKFNLAVLVTYVSSLRASSNRRIRGRHAAPCAGKTVHLSSQGKQGQADFNDRLDSTPSSYLFSCTCLVVDFHLLCSWKPRTTHSFIQIYKSQTTGLSRCVWQQKTKTAPPTAHLVLTQLSGILERATETR